MLPTVKNDIASIEEDIEAYEAPGPFTYGLESDITVGQRLDVIESRIHGIRGLTTVSCYLLAFLLLIHSLNAALEHQCFPSLQGPRKRLLIGPIC